MEFGKYSKMTVGDVAKSAATEGGAVIAGLIGAGVLGKQVEKLVKPNVVTTSPMLDKALAWAGNNGSKLAAYYLLRKEGGKMLHGYEVDIGKGVLGSVVLDTLIRFDNNYAPKPAVSLFGINFLGDENVAGSQNMQKILQENSSLRQQLNGALQRVASGTPSPIVNVTPVTNFPPDHDRQFGMMQSTPEAEERRKRYGTMTPPIEEERNRKYSAMKAQYNFAGDTESMSTAFGML